MPTSGRIISQFGAWIIALSIAASVGTALSAPPAQGRAATLSLNIPSQNLNDALQALALASQHKLLYASELVDGKRSPALIGEYTTEQAVAKLLSETDLTYEVTADGLLLIRPKNAPSGPLKRAAVQADEAVQTAPQAADSSQNFGGVPAIVTGKVTDSSSGANLKGALVAIAETGQTTSTDDLGAFRFPGVAPGTYTVRVSYLGFTEAAARIDVSGAEVRQNFALNGGSQVDALVVYGSRSARAQSLNQERTALNSTTVLEGDFLGQFDGTTISESLRRAPGIAFQPDPISGDGSNVIVRGMAPDYNMVTLNGQRLPVGNGLDRSPRLNNLLTESVSKITINKTLLPSQDSAGTGGLIEIETKGPFDRSRRFASFSVEGGRTGKDFLDESLASGTVSGIFGGNDAVGLSASVQYRSRDIRQISYSIDNLSYGQYLPLAADATPITSRSDIDPRALFPFESGADTVYPISVSNTYSLTELTDLSIGASGQWRVGENTLLRLDYNRADQKRDTFNRSQNIAALQEVQLLPVAQLGGEIRGVPVWQGAFGFNPINGGQAYALLRDQRDLTDTLGARGTTDIGRWNLQYGAGYTRGEYQDPNQFRTSAQLIFNPVDFNNDLDESLLAPEALGNIAGGRIASPFAPRNGNRSYPLPLLTQQGFELLNSASSYGVFSNASETQFYRGENDRRTLNFDARYGVDGVHLKYLKSGIYAERSESRRNLGSGSTITRLGQPSGPPFGLTFTLDEVGLALSEDNLKPIGINSGFKLISQADITAFADSIVPLSQGSNPLFSVVPVVYDPRIAQQSTEEKTYASYLETQVDFGRLEIVGGVRVERTDVNTVVLNSANIYDENFVPDADFALRYSDLIALDGGRTDFLPRILANLRWNEHLVIRGGYFFTVARPALEQLNQNTRSITLFLAPVFGPDGNQPTLSIVEGNPALKPAVTHNFDLSVEHYDDRVGAIKLAGFYKATRHALEQNTFTGFEVLDGVTLPADPRFENLPADIYIQVFRPANSRDTVTLWGVETSLEKQLTFLPGLWSGLGVLGNFTFTDSSKTVQLPFSGSPAGQVEVRDVPYAGQPKYSATAGLTYNKYDIDATLAYTAQDRYLTNFLGNNASIYQEAIDTLDFKAEYRLRQLPGNWRVYFEGSNLLQGPGDPNVETTTGGVHGAQKIYAGGRYYGGRVFRLGFAGTF